MEAHPLLAAGHVPSWSRVPPANGNAAADMIVNVVLHGDVALDDARVLARHGRRVENIVDVVHGAVLRVPVSAVGDLADEDAVQWVEPPLPAWGPLLDEVVILTGAKIVQGPFYDLDALASPSWCTTWPRPTPCTPISAAGGPSGCRTPTDRSSIPPTSAGSSAAAGWTPAGALRHGSSGEPVVIRFPQ